MAIQQPTQDDLVARRRRGPEYGLRYEYPKTRVRIRLGDVVLAESDRAVVLHETRHRPVYYLPATDVRTERLVASDLRTHCPFKGNATYWHLRLGAEGLENLVWSYVDAYPEANEIQGHLAFDPDRVELVAADTELPAPASSEITAGLEHNPLVAWLITEAWTADTPERLVQSLAEQMAKSDFAVARLWILVRTLHPLLVSTSYRWTESKGEVRVFAAPHDIVESEDYQRSPLRPILEGAGGVRKRLDRVEPTLDYPILTELQQEGYTDYVAMPMAFSDGQLNIISVATMRPGGFTTSDLGHLYEAIPLLSRLLEVFALRQNALNLLDTYLGHTTGGKVLEGLVRRGDAEDIYAVIWFCDLRDSTALAESGSRHKFLGLLNAFFEATGGAVMDHGGEVLRFIGDAALAIFPVLRPESPDTALREACARALAAARDAHERLAALNQRLVADGRDTLGWGIGLHVGEVTFGNIGTPTRLEFTVIGSAANEAARIEALTRTLGHPVLASEEFARQCAGDLLDLGEHPLRGLNALRRIYAVSVHDVTPATGTLTASGLSK